MAYDPLAGFMKKNNAKNDSHSAEIQNGVEYVKQHGGDPKQAAIQLLKERGIPIPLDPMALAMQLLKGRNNGG